MENEHGVLLRHPQDDPTEAVTNSLRWYFYTANETEDRIFSTGRMWHTNGSTTYLDSCGDHPEHATPECRSVRDLVAYNKAGEFLIADVFRDTMPFGHNVLLFKNNLGVDAEGHISGAYGCHENYLADVFDPRQPHHVSALIPFLVSRQIMDGAGWWEANGNFCFSQRALVMVNEAYAGASRERGIITIKDTSDTGPRRRLQIAHGDSNILEAALYLKMGTTSLVLSLLESGECPINACTNAVPALKEISQSLDATAKIMKFGINQDTRSALEVQATYWEACRHGLASASFDTEACEQESHEILAMWEAALNAISGHDRQWMVGRLDWATKLSLFDEYAARAKISSPAELKTTRKDFDISYHAITDRSLQRHMNTRLSAKRIVSDQDIRRATASPPSDTRAVLRGKFVRLTTNIQPRVDVYIDWNRVGYFRPSGRPTSLDMPDPFVIDHEGAQQYFTKLISDAAAGHVYTSS